MSEEIISDYITILLFPLILSQEQKIRYLNNKKNIKQNYIHIFYNVTYVICTGFYPLQRG